MIQPLRRVGRIDDASALVLAHPLPPGRGHGDGVLAEPNGNAAIDRADVEQIRDWTVRRAVPLDSARDPGAESSQRVAAQRHIRVQPRGHLRLRTKRNDRRQRVRFAGGLSRDARAIENRKERVLVRGCDNPFPAARRDECRRRVHVPIVRVVFDELVVRENPTGRSVEGNDGIRIQVVTLAQHDVEVRRWITRRHVQHVRGHVVRERRPERAAGEWNARVLPCAHVPVRRPARRRSATRHGRRAHRARRRVP